ncbi:MAG: AAA family ATPase [Acidimicrobiales bacterium]
MGGRRSGRRARKSALGLLTVLAIGLLVVAYAGVLELSRPHVSGQALRFDSFSQAVQSSAVRDARVLDEDAYVVGSYVAPTGRVEAYKTALLRGSQTDTLDLLVRNDVPTKIDQQVGKRVAALASFLLPGLILVVLFIYLILSHRRGTGLFGIKSGARRITPEESGVTFADVAGQDAAVAELGEIKEFLANPQQFEAVGAQIPKGVLLYGPPGCGKTMLAKALAAEAGAAFFSISGSDFVELYVGVGASRVRELFTEARANAPALLFIDEIDAIGRARGTSTGTLGHGEQEQALAQILTEMDGFSPSEGLIVLAATNRPDVLDPALLRPGRFDRSVGLERPGEADRLAILTVHARGKTLEPEADLAEIAGKAIGFTGADLANLLNEAALLTVRAGRASISQVALRAARQRILEAPERQRRLSLKERSVGRRYASEDRITFADVAGVDDAVAELTEIRSYLSDPERYAALGARLPRGILLSGAPGCGKTLLARAVAGEANAGFVSVAGSEFVEVFAGEGASRVRELFAEARALAPAIIFIDEIDAIGARRPAVSLEGHREREQTLNQILIEMDGFETQNAVIVMAATNRPDILDPALLRPGRFDRHLVISPPDREGRRAILGLHTAGKPLAADVDLDAVAVLTRGFSGADLANVVNEAALLAARRELPEIPMALMEEAVDRAGAGVASHAVLLAPAERELVAYHECGHALVARALPGAPSPHKLSIVPRGAALGRCTMADVYDRVVLSQPMLVDQMAGLLGGWAAEKLVFGHTGSGVSSDLDRATETARRMVCDYGMSEAVGPMTADAPSGASGHSEQAARLIDAEVRRLIDQATERAMAVLGPRRVHLDRLARALLDHETLSAAEIDKVLTEAGDRT